MKFIRGLRPLGCALVCLVGCATAAARTWKALYVFGDSYSDTGAGYVDGNGPTAVGYLAESLGIPFTHAADPDANGKSLNFAVSGAQTGAGDGRHVKDKLLGRGLRTQVDDFVERVKSGRVHFDPETTLFFLAGGLNDRRLPGATTVANLEGEIQSLHGIGGRYFLVALLPTKIRAFSEVGLRLNPYLAAIPADLKRTAPDAHVELSHWGEYFDRVMEDPGKYGITNTQDACAGRALFDQDATPRGAPDTYYFYHEGHPSTAVHRVVGGELKREVSAAFAH